MRILDSRRMTGSNLYTRESGAIVDLALDGADGAIVAEAWRRAITRGLPWAGELHIRHYAGGLALFVSGPLDVLMPLTELNDWAVACAEAELAAVPLPVLDPAILAAIEAARVPGLTALIAAARAHDVPLLVDEDAITLGTGHDLRQFPRQGPLPEPAAIDWDALGHIPIAIITGTNGKTTTTRLVARIAHAAGLVSAITSSDGVAIDERIVHRGDFSGPEGTRLALRHPGIAIAILETARGGILRRGLTVERCDAALITNVSGDHLGDYGIDDVALMAQVKAVVGRDARRVILNADDASLVALAETFAGELVWFSRHPDNPVLARAGGTAWLVRAGQLVVREAGIERALVPVDQIAITFGGRAAYNIENALAAAAVAYALGLSTTVIAEGLRTFTSSSVDNPGRGNIFDVGGIRVLLDFGHNPAAVRGVLALAHELLAPGGDLHVTIGMPGDRNDAEIAEVAHAVAEGRPARVIVRELPESLLRGRAPGTTPELLVTHLCGHGLAPGAVAVAASELAAVTLALDGARPGDLVVVFVHLDPEVDALLAARGASSTLA